MRAPTASMRIEQIRAIPGPNVYHHRPVLVMLLDLGDLAGRESREFPGFNERLVERLPTLREHHCSRGRPGGFVERLEEGTFFGHVVEHVALDLSEPAGIPAFFGQTRYAGELGLYNVVVAYRSEEGMRFLLRTAVELVEALLAGEPFPLEERLAEARRLVAEHELGPSCRAIVEAARSRGIPWARLNERSLVQLGYGRHRRFIQAAMTGETSGISVEIASDKELTRRLLREAAIPVPRGRAVRDEADARAALEELGGPVVVKPLDANQGKGVSTGLTTPEEVADAFRLAAGYSGGVLVEEQMRGSDYRVLVVGYRFVAASERRPAHVVGDGRRALAALVEAANADPRRGEGHEKPLTRIVIDEVAERFLRKQGRSPESVPAEGEVVYLRACANLSKGGTARDVTDLVHPDVRRLCERAARLVGLDVCGVDLCAEDVSRPLGEGEGILEVNAAPGLRMHLFPSEGEPRPVGDAIVEMLYPDGHTGRIPIVAITGTNGKTTVTRMIGHMLAGAGRAVGMTTTDGIYIGGACVREGDTTGPDSARTVLADPSVEVAVLETARGGIVRRGLGYDWSDVAVITNIREDHIGQDGIECIEDLLHIKSLVAERVRRGGTLVLNADDEQLVRLSTNPRIWSEQKRIVYFSLRDHHVLIRRHCTTGGTAFFVRDGWMLEAEGGEVMPVVRVADVPAALGGHARFQVANALAAAAASRALGASREEVAAGLASFSGAVHNPGRSNFFRLDGDRIVLVDYGHNPDAFESVGRMAALLNRPLTAVVGVPGDRNDEMIERSGRAAARSFRRILIKEDRDLRGRRPGEVTRLLEAAARAENPEVPCRVIPDETEALAAALDALEEGEMAVVFFEKIEPIRRLLEARGAVPVPSIAPPGMEPPALPVRPAGRAGSPLAESGG